MNSMLKEGAVSWKAMTFPQLSLPKIAVRMGMALGKYMPAPSPMKRETAAKEYPPKVIKAMDSLIIRGDTLCAYMQDKDFTTGAVATAVQQWLDDVNREVWDIIPFYADHITSELGALTGDEHIRYQGWDMDSAMMRVSVDRKLYRLRKIRSQIQAGGKEGSQS